MWDRWKILAAAAAVGAVLWMPTDATGQSEGLMVRLQGGYETLGQLDDGAVVEAAIGRRWSRSVELTAGVSAKLREDGNVCVLEAGAHCDRDERINVDILSVSITGRYFLGGGGDGPFEPFVGGRVGYERLMGGGYEENGVGIDARLGFDHRVVDGLALTLSGSVGYVALSSPSFGALDRDFSGTRVGIHGGIRWVL